MPKNTLTTGQAIASQLVRDMKANVKATLAELATATPEAIATIAANMPSTLAVPLPAEKPAKAKTVVALRAECKALGLRGYSSMKRDALVKLLADHAAAPVAVQAANSDRRTVKDLKAACKAAGIRGYSTMKRDELVALLATPVAERKVKLAVAGKQSVKAVKAELKLLGVKGYSKWNKARCVAELAKAVAAKNSAGATGVAGVLAVAASPVK